MIFRLFSICVSCSRHQLSPCKIPFIVMIIIRHFCIQEITVRETFKMFPSYLGKRHFLAVCTTPPFGQINRSRKCFRRPSLIGSPINAGERGKFLFFPSCLQGTNCKVFCADVFCPCSHRVVDFNRVIQFDVIDSYLDMNLFIRVEPVWWKCEGLTTWIEPFWNTEKVFSAPHNRKNCSTKKYQLKTLFGSCE